MARVLLIGRGPLPTPDQRHTGFAQLRTAHFHRALREAGHSVDLLLIRQDHAAGLVADARRRAADADLVVSAGPHRPGAVAVAAVDEQPLWLDLPGAPLAELQALLRAPGPPIPPERVAAAHAVTRSALARADHLSVISTPQRHAALGQLLLLGRATHTAAPLSVVPIAFDLPLPRGAPRSIPENGPVVLILSGSFAPWFDDTSLAAALEVALRAEPRLRVEVTGGGVSGHYTAGFERFRRWAAASPVAAQVRVHGWLPHAGLEAVLDRGHVGLCLDRPGAEPTLGSRTRVLLFAWCGLHVAASAGTELVDDLLAHDLATALPSDPPALARVLGRLVTAPPPAGRAAAAADHLARHAAPARIAAPLVDFAAAPRRHPPAVDPLAQVARSLEAAQAELAGVHASPTWRLLSRVHGALRRSD